MVFDVKFKKLYRKRTLKTPSSDTNKFTTKISHPLNLRISNRCITCVLTFIIYCNRGNVIVIHLCIYTCM